MGNEMPASKERRKYPHYRVTDEAVLLTAPKLELSDSLIDISLGGLAFSYEDSQPFQSDTMVVLDIVRDDVSIMNIPAKIISDAEIPHHPRFARRCGVAFGRLSKDQKEKILFLIAKLTAVP